MPVISQLPVATYVAGADTIPLSQNGFSRSLTISLLMSTYAYTLPQASPSTLGGITVGVGLGAASGSVSVAYGTTAGTAAQGNDSRITNALQASAIPAANGGLLGGSGKAGAASSVAIGAGLTLSGGILSAIGNGWGPVGSGAVGQLAYYSTTGTTLSPLTLGAGLSLVSGTLNVSASGVQVATGTSYAMQTADRVVDVTATSINSVTVTLPSAPTLWAEYKVIDGARNATSNNITLAAPNGGTINNSATFVMAANAQAMSLLAVNATTWRIV